MLKSASLIMLSLSIPPPLIASDFQKCLFRIEQSARQAGVSQITINEALKNTRFRPEVIRTDRHQPEFSNTFSYYLRKTVSDTRLAKGNEMMKHQALLLQKLKMKYGIPPHTLVALWGLESDFGQDIGQSKIIDSLATLACDQRRSTLFTDELISALKLMDRYGFSKRQMRGSWAGAIGHTQFMPSNYLAYAVAADNRSPPNLWNSIPDALSSAANFLQQLGWKPGWKWGREVNVPDSFDYRLTGLKTCKTLDEWHQLGVRSTSGQKIPEYHISGSVIAPGGHENPTFIVYDNFRIILQWNRSILYALSVGYLADRLKGRPPLKKPIKEEQRLSATQVKALQNKLNSLGYSCGKADGITGSATQQSIMAFQYSKKMIADGYPSESVLRSLGIKRSL